MECHRQDQEERHLQLPVHILETCELLIMTAGSTFDYSARLVFNTTFFWVYF